ncbi:lipocalin family protein [Pedobacter sp. SYP-B3415]|uniref:lipocalin family protein n=1 Tax=Pedobacter sp. SYP-B3415 TaxID=2496641 RepID=UPI00101DF541|nr:lipocalin family protein [Pedobacter sp. SYP-B3415]
MTKKITLFFALVLVMLAFGCKKDEIADNKDRLLGQWELTNLVQIEYLNDRETDRSEDRDDDLVFDFAANGGGRVLYGSENETALTWVLAEDHLTMKFDGETYLFSIRNLNNSEMTLVSEETRNSSQGIKRDVMELYLRKR